MQIHLIAIGKKPPAWVTQGFDDFAKRLPHEFKLSLIEINSGHRGKNADLARAIQTEGERMLAAIPDKATVVALEVTGKQWSTEQLADNLRQWQLAGQNLVFLIGGPDGLHPDCLKRAQCQWSLSKLTLPHALVRVVLSEQLYRAWSILSNHPYHRA